MNEPTVAIIGAGPIGLEAALTAEEHGYAATVYERGTIADAVGQWGHVRMFSPFGMNASECGLARLRATGATLPEAEALLTGAEFRESYLEPLARSLHAKICEKTSVRAIGRGCRLKGDFISDPERGAAPFRLLLRDQNGERIARADLVLDCSGTFAQPNSLGEGGIPAPGENAAAAHIHYGIPDLGERSTSRYEGKRILVVGSGHSAGTAIRDLARLRIRAPATEITWLIRHERETPDEEIDDDPLPERRRLAAAAHELVHTHQVRLIAGATIDSLTMEPDGVAVYFSGASVSSHPIVVDEIIAATGYRPDLTMTRELQVQTCWATEGTYPLAASLLGEAGADCLTTPVFGIETLLHPEPGYFALGMKSYGRSPNFLLRTGYEQVATVFAWLEREKKK